MNIESYRGNDMVNRDITTILNVAVASMNKKSLLIR